MSKIRKAATAAACTIGLTVGAFAMAGPAAAGTGDAIYDCYLAPNGPLWDQDVYVAMEHLESGHLTLFAELPLLAAPTEIVGSTYEGGNLIETGLTGSVTSVSSPVVLEKTFSTGTYATAPDEIRFAFVSPYPVTARCYVQSESGFPL